MKHDFTKDLLDTVSKILNPVSEQSCEDDMKKPSKRKSKREDDEDEDEDEMKEGYVSHAQRKAVWANRADDGKGHPDKKKKMKKEGYVPTADEPTEKDKQTAQKVRNLLAKEKKPIKLTPGWGDGGKSMKSSYGKLAKEEAEQIDELSKKTIGSYREKAFAQQPAGDDGSQLFKKRKAGRDMAFKKVTHGAKVMAKEEAEQIDEISGKTLASYSDKVARYGPMKDVRTRQKHELGLYTAYKKMKGKNVKVPARMEEADVPFEGPYRKTGERKDEYGNTVKNVAKHLAKKAMKKQMGGLKKEEAEQIDELSAKTIDRYREQSHRKEYPGPKGSKKYGKRARGSIMAFNKLTGRAKVPARMEEAEITEARGRPRKDAGKDFTIHPKTKEKLMHNNPAHMKRIENLYRVGTLKRPKTEADQNVITQLRKASTSMTGSHKVNFSHGAATHVSGPHATKILSKHAAMKPAEKEAFQKEIGHSYENLKKHI